MSGSSNISAALEETFEMMRIEGKNDVDSLVNWMKDAKIIESAKEGEKKVRELFQGVDEKNVDLEKFKEVVAKTAAEQKKTLGDVSKALSETGLKIVETLQGLQAGVSALADIFKK